MTSTFTLLTISSAILFTTIILKGNKQAEANADITASTNNQLSTKYLSDDYPFLHIEDTKDVLGQFFKKG